MVQVLHANRQVSRFCLVVALVAGVPVVAAQAQPNTPAPQPTSTPTGNVITIDTTQPVCVDAPTCALPVIWQGNAAALNTWVGTVAPAPPVGTRPPWTDALLDAVDEIGVNRVVLAWPPGIQSRVDYRSYLFNGGPTPTPALGLHSWRWDQVDGGTFYWTLPDAMMDNMLVPLRQRLAAHGEHLFWNFEYYNNSHVSGDDFTAFRDNPGKFAAWVNAIWTHLESKYGFVPDGFSLNEPSTTGDGWTMAQVGAAIKAIGDSLAASGWHPRFESPASEHLAASLSPNAQSDFDALIGQTGVSAYLTDLDFHTYGGYAASDLTAIVSRAATHGLQLGMSEFNGEDQNELQDLIANGLISYSRQGGIAGGSTDCTRQTQGLLCVNTNTNAVSIVNPAGYYWRQYYKFIHQGAAEVHSESTQSYNLRPVAFVNTNGATVVVVNHVAGSGTFGVRGLPAGTYNIKYSVTGDVDHDLAPQTIGNGQILRTSIPAVGVITVYRDDTIIPTHTTTRIPTDNPTVTNSPTWTPRPTNTQAPTWTPRRTPSPSPTGMRTSTPTLTNTATSIPTATPTASNSPTWTPSPTNTQTPTQTPSRTPSPSPTASPSTPVTPLPTSTTTSTQTPAHTLTTTHSAMPTGRPTLTPTIGTTLAADVSAIATAIPVDDINQLPNSGTIRVGEEQMRYNGKQAPAGAGLFDTETSPQRGALLNVERGVNGTTPTVHPAGAPVILVAAACIGDCNGSRDVTVDELLSLVNIALNNAPASECLAGDANHDERITIDEILTAVNSALNGCP